VVDVMRCLLYHDGHLNFAKASGTYRELPVNAAACANCPGCTVSCPWQVAVRSRLERAHGALA
jgi:predicted aldo/keto reductase-like oxidoreductase